MLNAFTSPSVSSPVHKVGRKSAAVTDVDIDIEAPFPNPTADATARAGRVQSQPSSSHDSKTRSSASAGSGPRTLMELQQKKLQQDGIGCTWSGEELIDAAAGLDRVTVTPAWTLQNALGAIGGASAVAPAAAATQSSPSVGVPTQASPSARIVYELATSQGTDLVISGCTGSYNLVSANSPSGVAVGAVGEDGVGNGGDGGEGGVRRRTGTDSTSVPTSGGDAGPEENKTDSHKPSSVHSHRENVRRSIGPLNLSRHSLSFQTWHPGRTLTGSRHSRNANRGTPARGARVRSLSRSNSSLSVHPAGGEGGALGPHNELEPWVGDVIAMLAYSERAPAMLAVRASDI